MDLYLNENVAEYLNVTWTFISTKHFNHENIFICFIFKFYFYFNTQIICTSGLTHELNKIKNVLPNHKKQHHLYAVLSETTRTHSWSKVHVAADKTLDWQTDSKSQVLLTLKFPFMHRIFMEAFLCNGQLNRVIYSISTQTTNVE